MYYANFVANDSTRNEKPYTGTNLRKLIRDIRETAEGNTFQGGSCRWYVENESGQEVARGGLDNGRRFRSI